MQKILTWSAILIALTLVISGLVCFFSGKGGEPAATFIGVGLAVLYFTAVAASDD